MRPSCVTLTYLSSMGLSERFPSASSFITLVVDMPVEVDGTTGMPITTMLVSVSVLVPDAVVTGVSAMAVSMAAVSVTQSATSLVLTPVTAKAYVVSAVGTFVIMVSIAASVIILDAETSFIENLYSSCEI